VRRRKVSYIGNRYRLRFAQVTSLPHDGIHQLFFKLFDCLPTPSAKSNYNYPFRAPRISTRRDKHRVRSEPAREPAQLSDDIYRKKAAKAPTPATKPAAFREEAAPVNSAGVLGLV
jgi:hypothetical protein